MDTTRLQLIDLLADIHVRNTGHKIFLRVQNDAAGRSRAQCREVVIAQSKLLQVPRQDAAECVFGIDGRRQLDVSAQSEHGFGHVARYTAWAAGDTAGHSRAERTGWTVPLS
jgi:hypothetical protein